MSCPSETRLQAFVDGELSEDELTELSEHLDTCEECRTIVGALQPLPLDDDTTADRVGRYVLRRILGQGGMGTVYEAVDPELHRVVALKVLREAPSGTQRRLLAEAQAMAKLAHPNVVAIYDVGRDGDRAFIVMALVTGVSLRHWLAQESRALPAILDAFTQAGEGLRAAHDAGLVHRDFKPENVFVANDGRVLVGDFGLAIEVATGHEDASGSLAYMAPEQRRGEQVDARSDQYSFALALAEAAPRALPKIIARATRESADERYPSMTALLTEIRASQRRSRLPLAIIAAVVAVMVAFFAFRGPHGPEVVACRAREAEMHTVWNDAVASQIEQTFRATKSPLADAAWKTTHDVLAEYTQSWSQAQSRLCEAPRDASMRAVLDERASCLGERLEMTRAVTASLAKADAPVLEQVEAMLQLLPRVSACEDPRELAQLAPPPTAAQLAGVNDAKKKIATAAATIAAGRYQEGLRLADDAFVTANGTGYLPVIAEAYLWVGTAHGRLGHAAPSEQALDHAASSASAGRAQIIAVRAWVALMHFVGFEAKRYDDGARWSDDAKAALESLPGAYELEAERLSWSRAMLLDRKRYDDALVVSRQELALVELRFGPSHRLAAAALDGLAGVLAGQCKARDALEPQEKSCAILEKNHGVPHPQVALCLGNLAALHAALGEHSKALGIKESAVAMFELVPGHPNHVAMAHRNIVRSLLELDRLDDAAAELTKAAALSQRESDETSIIILRGDLHRRQGQLDVALAGHALAVTRTEGGEPSRRLDPLLALAQTQLAASHFSDALVSSEKAGAIARSIYGEGTCRTAEPMRDQAEALLGAGRAHDALPFAERALAALAGAQIDPRSRARTEALLTRARP